MRKKAAGKSFKDFSNREIWEHAFVALQRLEMETFFHYLEFLRRRFILRTANSNDEFTSRRNIVSSDGIMETPTSPSADAFVGYYKQTRPSRIDVDTLEIKKAYVVHYDLTSFVGNLLMDKIDPTAAGFNERFERLIRYELFLKVLSGFLPGLKRGNVDDQDLIINMHRDVRARVLEQPAYSKLRGAVKKSILDALEKEWSITLPLERMESFLAEMKSGILGQPAIKEGVNLHERDEEELNVLIQKRRADTDPLRQVDKDLFHRDNPYLAFVLEPRQILDILNKADSILLSDVQLESLFNNLGKKCENFSARSYENPVGFIKDRRIAITPELKAAVIRNCINLEGRVLEAYSKIKNNEIREMFYHRKMLNTFIVKTSIITVEDLLNASFMGLNRTLLRLQSKERAQWVRWKTKSLLQMKIERISQVISYIREEGGSCRKRDLIAALRSLQESQILRRHQNWFTGLFSPLTKTSTVVEVEELVKDCENAESNLKLPYRERFAL